MSNNEVVEVVEEIPGDQPVVEEFDSYTYELPNGRKQTIKYKKGNIQEALDIAAHNHAESVRTYAELSKKVALGEAQLPDDKDVEKVDYSKRTFKPRALTAEEQWIVLNQPGSPEAVRLQSQAQYGADPEVVAETLQAANNDIRQMRAQEEAQAFAAETPEWATYASPENGHILVRYVGQRGWAPTKVNFARAFKDLKEELSPRSVPTVTEETQANPQPETVDSRTIPVEQPVTTRRVPTTSGLNNRNSRDTGAAVVSRSKWTADQINKMSGTEYERHFKSDPSFRKFVDDNSALLD
jgi:hypothetical protein